ncbi:magnesium-protoporphyrin IX monomethyl ester anaerobic oxidative cyclase [Anaerohalosphaera lusitana]|uniref:Magnesium-protoporphyrin IX monomethyl ester anaerobic oxidative cyclase n=1 Tax=Anaerohalosphaera lusitana TaxID=1936003 RepID=A0A1U9NJ25_9BACT|nr:radical SAM protein [Anaerohalosphaera lusitana]AQT67787.1 magnesium-protoporphyrin IX monomethyl ester anaerobic oxidative cyclase [Anaerohalosphaera lusitana]
MEKRKLFRMVVLAYPAFNIYSNIAKKTTALGPVCVASAANKLAGWDVEVVDENNLGRFGPRSEEGGADHEELERLRPADVVGFYGGLTSTAERIYRLAEFYKGRGVFTVGGGQHFMGENLEEGLRAGIDVIVRGEGEPVIRELLEMVERHEEPAGIAGLAYMQDGKVVQTEEREKICDFEEHVLPDFSLVRYARLKIYPVEWVRGCGMNCEFCTVKGRPRAASVERIMEQFRRIVEIHGGRQFFVVDDLFGQMRDDTIRLCDMLSEYQERMGVRLFITVQIRLDRARDEELLRAMRRAGIKAAAIGFESPIDEELAMMRKSIRAEDMLEYVKVFRRCGFLVHGMFIFGYPLRGDQSVAMSIEERRKRFTKFIRKSKLDTIQVLMPVPLPGTELRERLDEEGRLYAVEDVGWKYYDGNFPLFEPAGETSAEQMQAATHKIMAEFYRFRSMFLLAVSVISFPAVVLASRRLQSGWLRWYRSWRNNLVRFGGWIILRRWTVQFERGDFTERLKYKRRRLGG